MSRSGYSDDLDDWALICWRGAVTKAIKGKRGQAFLKEMLAAMDAMPEKKLVKSALVTPQGEVCAIGSAVVHRGVDIADLKDLDLEDNWEYVNHHLAKRLDIAPALVAEIENINDEAWDCMSPITDERRFEIVRHWVESHIKEAA